MFSLREWFRDDDAEDRIREIEEDYIESCIIEIRKLSDCGVPRDWLVSVFGEEVVMMAGLLQRDY